MSLAARYVCGFLAQIVPCAFFCLYPFSNRFKVSKRLALGGASLALALMCCVFTLVGLYGGELRILWQNIVFYITLLLLLALYLFWIRAYSFKKLFVFGMAANYGFLVQEISTLTRFVFAEAYFSRIYDGYMYPPKAILLSVFINAALFVPMLFVMRRTRRALESPIDNRLWRGLSIIPSVFFILVNAFWHMPSIVGDLVYTKAFLQSHYLLTFSMLFFMGFCLLLIFKIIEDVRKAAEERARLELMVDNYHRIVENTEQIKKMRHELSHHLTMLQLYLKDDNYDGARAYLDGTADAMSKLPTIDYTPHALLNSILTEYSERAETAGIRVEYDVTVPERLAVEDIDLCRLLTNLLDNAIEGSAGAKEKSIHLKIRRNGSFLFFSCENGCDGARIRYDGDRLVSTKEDGEAHGLGLRIMNEVAEKYNGAFHTEIDGSRFTALASLCLPD